MAAGSFRHDLYYRLCTHQIEIPPLRERTDDIAPLIRHFIEKTSDSLKRKPVETSAELIRMAEQYTFPGNVRELEALVVDAVVRSTSDELPLDGFRQVLDNSDDVRDKTEFTASGGNFEVFRSIFGGFPRISQVEDYLIMQAIKEADGNQGAAANLLGITRQTLNKRLGEIRGKS